ncbi:MAG: cation:proton antiporter [Polyangia bacterium]
MAAFTHSPLALFIVQAIVIILTSRLLGLLTRRIRQPQVVAEVTAGILLGPSLLGWLWPEASQLLFPRASLATLQMFSQIGLILFMFLIGLELDPRLLRGRGRQSAAISQAGIALPFALGVLLAIYLHPRLSDPGVPFLSFALFMGVAMSITAFPVLARILSESRMLRTKVGAVAITAAAIDDVMGWCLLAFVVSVVQAGGVRQAVLTTLLTLGYAAAMLFLVRPFLARFALRASTREGLSQNMVAATFLLVLASSLSTDLIGVHALFGAFLLGVIIPKDSPFSVTLADKIEDFAVVFLLPMFFAYSGLRTQIGLLSAGSGPSLWPVVFSVIALAIAGKFGGCALAARLTGLSWREASTLGILMNTRGLMELVVLNIGLDLGVISPALFTIMVLMALVTTFMTSPLLSVVYPPALYETALAEPSPDGAGGAGGADDARQADYCVLMCVSFSGTGPGMVTLSEALLRGSSERSRLYALKLQRPTERTSTYLADARELHGTESALGPLVDQAQRRGLVLRPLSFLSSDAGRDICNVAEVKGADLVLLGWHRPLFNRAALGGTVNEVLSSAQPAGLVGVLVDRGLQSVRRVLVPFNNTEHDRAALRLAHRLVEHAGVEVTVLHVVPPPRDGEPARTPRLGVEEQVQQVFGEPRLSSPGATVPGEGAAAAHTPVTVKVVEHGEPAEAALREVARAPGSAGAYDLVLIGLGEEWGLKRRPFGISQEYLIRTCPTSLLIVRGPTVPEKKGASETKGPPAAKRAGARPDRAS